MWLLTQRLELNAHGDFVDSLEHNYISYFSDFGLCLRPLSNFSRKHNFSDYDGLILTGGGDMPGSLCEGHSLSLEADGVAYSKYNIQRAFLEDALSRGKKVLAICYGAYLVYTYFGSMVTCGVHGSGAREPGTNHKIELLDEGGREMKHAWVNTYHNDGIRVENLPQSFHLFARDAEFDLVEGARHKDLPVLCLQWHPERRSPDTAFNQKIISKFLLEQ